MTMQKPNQNFTLANDQKVDPKSHLIPTRKNGLQIELLNSEIEQNCPVATACCKMASTEAES